MLQAPNCPLKHHKNKSVPVLLVRLRLVRTGENKAGEILPLESSGESWRASRYLSPKLTRRQLKNRQARQISLQGSPGENARTE
ncbi:hypothetical protein A2U01_0054450, partial [Trifolium medium]|nr:hypothetical protein [Trifolium medium]